MALRGNGCLDRCHDAIVYASAFTSRKGINVPSFVLSIAPEDIQGFMSALHGLGGSRLDLILHSPGGSPEAAEQIVTYLRSKYDHIRAIIPPNAMSAATMIACGLGCDEIVMGKHSALGPIDPQVTLGTRGREIANWLGAADEHRSHGKPLGIDQLRSHGLRITALEDDQEFQERVLSLFHATTVTFEVSNCMKLVENHLGKGAYVNVQIGATAAPPTASRPSGDDEEHSLAVGRQSIG